MSAEFLCWWGLIGAICYAPMVHGLMRVPGRGDAWPLAVGLLCGPLVWAFLWGGIYAIRHLRRQAEEHQRARAAAVIQFLRRQHRSNPDETNQKPNDEL